MAIASVRVTPMTEPDPSVETERRKLPSTIVPESPAKVRPTRGWFKALVLADMLKEELVEVDRIRLAELAALRRVADMD